MQSRKVAVIDNDQKSLSEIEEFLLLSGYDPVLVSDPSLAVHTVLENKPDVILIELKMPRKNGLELTDSINRAFETKRVPVIAMSDFFKEEFSWLLDLCGIKRWLKKPFQPLDVIWAIENEVEESSLWEKERRW